ncbi:hypothetical protein Daus18300_008702 [Diaporthe australafricana]|uniref:Uncharacterized protein n=1 Tax=Diaporthe australafricana TaxID=127596 RepID=A0ABR3WHG8_9PEZI
MPAATGQLAHGGAPALKKRKLNGRKVPTSKIVVLRPEAHDARSNPKLKLTKPLTPKDRRVITQKASKLMRKRNELDRAVLLQTFQSPDGVNAEDWLPREELLRQCERMAKAERSHIRERTRALVERTELYNRDPSQERALDLKMARTLLLKFKRHLGPYLEAAEEPERDDEDDVSSSASESDSSAEEEDMEQGKVGDSDLSRSSKGDGSDGSFDNEKPSVGLDGAFDDISNPRKRRRTDPDGSRKESKKKARKEQAPDSIQSTTSQTQSAQSSTPTRSKEMEASLAEIFSSMSKTKDPKASVNGASKVKVEDGPAEATTDGTNDKVNGKAPKTPVSSSASSASDGGPVPFYQRHAKAMLRPDFDDLVYDRPQRRRGPKSKQKPKEYLMSGALPDPHLPSPKPEKKNNKKKKKARNSSKDGS